MKSLPYLQTENGRTTLMVDDEEFLILGGELHNSSGSSLEYMEEHVWPGLRRLGGNCYLTPVYWECMEPERGIYDFTLVDGVIAQAHKEGVRLVLLWFGLWKNGNSAYMPAWMKKNPDFYYMENVNGVMQESVSPFCQEAVELDRKAFTAMMSHLKEIDEERTVIMVQVENEIGIWGSPRDYGKRAEELFHKEIPEEMAILYETNGTWETAFGQNAPEYFMAWGFSKALEKIASSGKAVYDLPMFMNCVVVGLPFLAGQLPSGQPLPRVHKIWRHFAPSIDLYGPDIYAPFFKEVSSEFAAANALIIPELGQDKDTASKALYALGAYNTICFSPFGIDGMMTPLRENDLLSQMNTDLIFPSAFAAEILAEAYDLIRILWKDIRRAQEENRIYAFLQQHDMGAEFVLDDYTINVTYGDGGMSGHMGQPGHRREDGPVGGGFIIRKDADTFLICGIACNVKVSPKYASREHVFMLNKKELFCKEGKLVQGRILNGDERNYTVIGSRPGVLEVTFYRR